MRKLIFSLAALAAAASAPAGATSGPGCLVVVNVAQNDALNMRSRPSMSARIVDVLVPGDHGIIHLDAPCGPRRAAWRNRWCPVSHYNGNDVTRGWVKARFVRDVDCP